MSDFKIMTTVTASYEPQDGQSYRCSSNFPDWNTSGDKNLKFRVVIPDGYPQPTFAITHDKSGDDKRWYSNLSDGVSIPVDSGSGGAGSYKLYIGTTSKLPSGYDGKQKYAVVVYVSQS